MPAPKSLRELQRAQRDHDQAFHRDVFQRSSPDRVRHYCLHYGKYVGRLARAPPSGDELEAALKSTLTDAMIITLAFSDVLNVDLDEQLEAAFGKPSKAGLSGWTASIDISKSRMTPPETRDYAFEKGALATGDLCKVAESLDHIESFDPRSRLIEGLIAWLALLLVSSSHLNFDLVQAVEARWKEIERKRVT